MSLNAAQWDLLFRIVVAPNGTMADHEIDQRYGQRAALNVLRSVGLVTKSEARGHGGPRVFWDATPAARNVCRGALLVLARMDVEPKTEAQARQPRTGAGIGDVVKPI